MGGGYGPLGLSGLTPLTGGATHRLSSRVYDVPKAYGTLFSPFFYSFIIYEALITASNISTK